MRKGAGVGTATIGDVQVVDNLGTVAAESGVIDFAGGYAAFHSTQFIGAGTVRVSSNAFFNGLSAANLELAGGLFTGQGGPAQHPADLYGQVRWSGGQFAGGFWNHAALTVLPTGQTGLANGSAFYNDGTVQGAGVITATNASFSNNGILSPGNPFGMLVFNGNLYESSASTMQIAIGGNQTNQFSSLTVGGTLVLAGTLRVSLENGFAPAVGTKFPILSCTNRTGTFGALTLPTGFSINYTNTGAFLIVASAVPAQILFPQVSGANFTFRIATASNQSYTVQTSADMTASNWHFFTNFTGNGLPFQITTPVTTAPQLFFRVREP